MLPHGKTKPPMGFALRHPRPPAAYTIYRHRVQPHDGAAMWPADVVARYKPGDGYEKVYRRKRRHKGDAC
jgi:hypothetical protein